MQNSNIAFRSNTADTSQKSMIHKNTAQLSAAAAVSHLNVCPKCGHPLQALSHPVTDLVAPGSAERGLKAFPGMLTEYLTGNVS